MSYRGFELPRVLDTEGLSYHGFGLWRLLVSTGLSYRGLPGATESLSYRSEGLSYHQRLNAFYFSYRGFVLPRVLLTKGLRHRGFELTSTSERFLRKLSRV